jgi:hypothetical protein
MPVGRNGFSVRGAVNPQIMSNRRGGIPDLGAIIPNEKYLPTFADIESHSRYSPGSRSFVAAVLRYESGHLHYEAFAATLNG